MPRTRPMADRPRLLPIFERLTARLNFEELIVVAAKKGPTWWLFDTKTVHPPQRCSNCEQTGPLWRFGTKKQYFEDTPLEGRPVRIRVTRQRYKCPNCRQSFYEPIDGLDDIRLASRRLVEFIAKAALQRPFSHVAQECGVHEKTVRCIAHSFFKALDAIAHFPTPRWLGIDDVFLNGALRTVLTNLKDKKVYEILQDSKPETIEAFLRGMPGRESVELVCMDFSALYRKQVRACLPAATIVVDMFHILQLANKAIDQIRRRVKKKKRVALGYDTRILRKRRSALTSCDKKALRRWKLKVPELAMAFALKEQFCKVWKAKDPAAARQLYGAWKDTCLQKSPRGFRQLIQTIGRWEDDVFAGQTKPITNGYAEGMNGIVKNLNRQARGLAFEALRAKLLYMYGYARSKRESKKPRWPDEPLDDYVGEESVPSLAEARSLSRERTRNTIHALAESYVGGHEYDEYLRALPPDRDHEPPIETGVWIEGEEYVLLPSSSVPTTP